MMNGCLHCLWGIIGDKEITLVLLGIPVMDKGTQGEWDRGEALETKG